MGGKEGAATEVGGKPDFPLVEGGRWAKCCRVVEEELEGVAVGFGDLWRAVADNAGRTGPIFSVCDLPLRKPLPSLGEGLERPEAAQLLAPSLPSTPLSVWRSGWACAGRLAHCQQFFLQAGS